MRLLGAAYDEGEVRFTISTEGGELEVVRERLVETAENSGGSFCTDGGGEDKNLLACLPWAFTVEGGAPTE